MSPRPSGGAFAFDEAVADPCWQRSERRGWSDEGVGAAEAIAGAALQYIEGELLAGLAQTGVGRDLALDILEEDVLAAVDEGPRR
jgi:hypothetical protein